MGTLQDQFVQITIKMNQGAFLWNKRERFDGQLGRVSVYIHTSCKTRRSLRPPSLRFNIWPEQCNEKTGLLRKYIVVRKMKKKKKTLFDFVLWTTSEENYPECNSLLYKRAKRLREASFPRQQVDRNRSAPVRRSERDETMEEDEWCHRRVLQTKIKVQDLKRLVAEMWPSHQISRAKHVFWFLSV